MSQFLSDAMPWIEKYRPTHFDGIVLDPMNRVFFKNILQKQHFPNLLFYGPPGTGKTTTIINLINEYQDRYTKRNRESIIHLNASDERGIDIIRTQIYQFVRSKHIFEVGLKFVILDEVDYMTKNAQQALKTLLQTSLTNVRFCLICNYISKIDESLQYEFVCVRFNQLPTREIHQFIRAIAEKEDITISDDMLDIIRDTYQSDIRSMINYLQSMDSKTATTTSTTTSTTNTLMTITNTDWTEFHENILSRNLAETYAQLHHLSTHYNIHKRNLLFQYMNYIIRRHPHLITHSLLDIMEKTAHANDHVPIRSIIEYFFTMILHSTEDNNHASLGDHHSSHSGEK